jgi:hypothetical protein
MTINNESVDRPAEPKPRPSMRDDRRLPGKLQLEVEGGPTARELEVDEREIRREDLLGQKGAEAQGRALQKLRELM